ncbi:hypothetical protein JHK82_034256 [Glycine max]|nr:hypothetical protein JHK85_034968 [Glycine max]KAG4986635.1 hypothetical protein JHK86_034326 [Glycine max]KAG5119836.1 hypothetical protein JHK82_034256 [Glycine max]KAG5140825.1 hypothetical protein JHK84_034593 [Glycine max]KAH1143746.1 hypothetical protein GYH30_034120 [Glycine max]
MTAANSAAKEFDVISMQSDNITYHQKGVVVSRVEMEGRDDKLVTQVSGFDAKEGVMEAMAICPFHYLWCDAG